MEVMVSVDAASLPPGHTRRSAEYRRLLWALFAVGVATFAQLYSPQALLPQIARDLRVSPSRAALIISASTIGLAVAVLPLSILADRLGRIRTMTLGLVGATACGLLSPLAPAFELMLAGRICEGMFLGAVPAVAVAYLNEEVAALDAARAAGVYIAGTTIGGLAGRLISAPVAEAFGWRAGIMVVAGICACAALTFRLLAPPSRRFTPSKQSLPEIAARLKSVITPRLLAIDAQGALLMGGFVGVYNFIGFRLTGQPFNLSPTVTAFVFLAYLAGTVTSAASGRIVQRAGRLPLLLGGSAVMAVGVVMTLAQQLVVVIVGIIVATGGYFAAHSTASGWAGFEAVGARAQASGIYNVFVYAGSSLFGWGVGIPLHRFGWPGAVVLVLCLIAVAMAIAATALRGPARTSPAATRG
jgi:predicted MFS family arabinose efflux permease